MQQTKFKSSGENLLMDCDWRILYERFHLGIPNVRLANSPSKTSAIQIRFKLQPVELYHKL